MSWLLIWLAIGFTNWLAIRTFYDWWIEKPPIIIGVTILGPILWLFWLRSLIEHHPRNP